MSRNYQILDPDQLHFVTFTVIHWIDVFIRDDYRSIFAESIHFCQKRKGLEVFAYCLMPSHAHMILGREGAQSLSGIIRDMKAFTSGEVRHLLESEDFPESRKEWMLKMMYREGRLNRNNRDFQFWQQHSHPIALTTFNMAMQKLQYTHMNPVKAGFVDCPEAWTYSSAKDYAGQGKGPIEVKFIC